MSSFPSKGTKSEGGGGSGAGFEKSLKYPGSSDFCKKFPARSMKIPYE